MNIDHYFEQCGEGSPIVFIHGSYATTSTWKKMVEVLSASHHCISIKLPGHCGMPDPGDFAKPTIETELSVIEQVVRSVTDQPIHLVGHSYGGVVALSLALKGSLPLRELTLFEPVSVWVLNTVNDQPMLDLLETFITPYRQAAADQIPYACGQVIDFWGGQGSFDSLPSFIKEAMVPLLGNNVRHWDLCTKLAYEAGDLQQLLTPTQIVYGSESNQIAKAIATHLQDLIPNSEKYQINGSSHFMVNSHTDECLAILQK
jgi:pimeloyl-ACP methyl ester carboxylesterase